MYFRKIRFENDVSYFSSNWKLEELQLINQICNTDM